MRSEPARKVGVQRGRVGVLSSRKVSLFERAGALGDVAVHAAAHHVVPGRATAARARNHVVQVQLRARQLPAAVLAGVVVARVDVVAGKAHLGPRNAIVDLQQDHARHADGAIHGVDHVVPHLGRKLGPAVEIEGAKLPIHGLRGARVEERERPLHVGHVDGLKMPVQNQNRAVDHGVFPMAFAARRSASRSKRAGAAQAQSVSPRDPEPRCEDEPPKRPIPVGRIHDGGMLTDEGIVGKGGTMGPP
jgi:hypothetical protein